MLTLRWRSLKNTAWPVQTKLMKCVNSVREISVKTRQQMLLWLHCTNLQVTFDLVHLNREWSKTEWSWAREKMQWKKATEERELTVQKCVDICRVHDTTTHQGKTMDTGEEIHHAKQMGNMMDATHKNHRMVPRVDMWKKENCVVTLVHMPKEMNAVWHTEKIFYINA